jgi:hypothetical protein
MRGDGKMSITFGEIENLIMWALFEQVGESEKLEKKYNEVTFNEDKSFELEPGDEIKTKEARYIVKNKKTVFCGKTPLIMNKIPRTPNHFLQFIQYTNNKRAELRKGVSLNKLIFKLALEINSYFTKPKMCKKYYASISKRKERKLVLSLYKILNESASYIDSQHKNLAFYYIAKVLQSCGINKTQHGLYIKYRDSIA